ncbi:MAG TPA: LysM peptidoglycan-binding domain-containing protein [Mobilitalea sp.]|nr:LysM peptidoglycan-binding domain-containing protein [Mobilitalea sp.]
MIIHVVQRGETTKSIAECYGISEERLILENNITNPNRLAIGEALVVLYPEITYTVQDGDTLFGIADKNGVPVLQLLRNNPYLSDREYIFPGEKLVVKYVDEKIMTLATNGYAYPFIDRKTLKKTLPFLTYLTVFSYKVTANGEILDVNDRDIIKMAKVYGVAPIMMLTAQGENQSEEINVTHAVLHSKHLQDMFLSQLLTILKDKGYYGVNINTPYVIPEDRNHYEEFMKRFTSRMISEGFMVLNTLSLSAFEILTGTMYNGLEYEVLGKTADATMLISYEWGYTMGVPSGIAYYQTLEKLLNNMTELIPPEKLFIGESSIGYIWRLPYEAGVTKGLSIAYNTAIDVAYEYGAEIKYDDTTKSAYYQYISADEYMVRFRDARSIAEFTKLVPSFGLKGVGSWNIMKFFPQMWLVLNSQYNFEKVT